MSTWDITRQRPDDYDEWKEDVYNGGTLLGFEAWLANLAELAAEPDEEQELPVNPCVECGEEIQADDVHAGYGMCGSCVHNAVRSGWTPGDPV